MKNMFILIVLVLLTSTISFAQDKELPSSDLDCDDISHPSRNETITSDAVESSTNSVTGGNVDLEELNKPAK